MNRFLPVKSYPAYDVVKLNPDAGNKVFDGEFLYNEQTHTSWKLGSVVGYAVEKGIDPIKSYNDAIERGHDTHYAFSVGASLTSGHRDKEPRRISVDYGDEITFQGQKFIIEKANNDNINLIKV